MFKLKNIFIAAALLIGGMLSGCRPETSQPTPPIERVTATVTSTLTPEPTATTAPTPTPTPIEMTICVGKPIESLFFYNQSTAASMSVLAALYDGPFKSKYLNNSIPAIWSGMPESSALEPVDVFPGDPYYDPSGQLTVLAEGMLYRPAGCADSGCWQTYTGTEPVQMDVWVLRFRLQANLHWSDGAPLTATDSVYAYELARSLQPAGQRSLIDRTASYSLEDDLTVVWRGVAGYQSAQPLAQIFWPLPEHAWGEIALAELPGAAIAAQNPPGYGPFMVSSWDGAQGLTLARNPEYFLAGEGLPRVDLLHFRVVAQGQAALDALLNGSCDVLDSSATSESLLAEYASSAGRGEIQLARQPAALELVFFNIEPYNIYQARLLGKTEVRQAIAHCFDSRSLAESVLSGLAFPAVSYLAPLHPDLDPYLASTAAPALAYDPAAGQQLLQRSGWLDLDLNPETPRTAKGIPGVPDGTRFTLTYLVSGEADRLLAAEQFRRSMAVCGIGVEVVVSAPQEYLAPGPDGPVFGRTFQMAEFAWTAAGGEVPCALFTSPQVPAPYPTSPLDWGGANASAYRSPAFDQSCWQASFSLAESAGRAAAVVQVQQMFINDVPALPLYWRPRLALARADVCGLAGTVLDGALLAAPERLSSAPGCPEP